MREISVNPNFRYPLIKSITGYLKRGFCILAYYNTLIYILFSYLKFWYKVHDIRLNCCVKFLHNAQALSEEYVKILKVR